MAIDKAPGLRLEIFIKSLRINQKKFSERLDTSSKFVSQLVNGHSNLTVGMTYRIGKVFPQLNQEWLLHGTGEMLLSDKPGETGAREPDMAYGTRPLGGLDALLQTFEQRIKQLEEKVRKLEDQLQNK